MSGAATYEPSVQDNNPRELVHIEINDGAGDEYFHTSASRDISYGGDIYTAIAMDRGALTVIVPNEETELVLTLPIDHALVRRWPAQAAPPMKVVVTLMRMYPDDTVKTEWVGEIRDMASDGGAARFRIPSRAGQWMLKTVPSFTLSDQCVHALYDTRCAVSRTGSGPGGVAHKVTATIISKTGRDIKVDLATTDRNDDWALDGEIVHTSSGERRSVIAQSDIDPGVNGIATLTMNLPIPELVVGDSVDVYAGCDHDIDTCVEAFGNRQNYLGWHHKPARDFFSPVLGGTKA